MVDQGDVAGDWASFEAEAEAVVRACAAEMQGLMPPQMLMPAYLGRLRSLAREHAARLGEGPRAVHDHVVPYEERVADLCGLALPPLLADPDDSA